MPDSSGGARAARISGRACDPGLVERQHPRGREPEEQTEAVATVRGSAAGQGVRAASPSAWALAAEEDGGRSRQADGGVERGPGSNEEISNEVASDLG